MDFLALTTRGTIVYPNPNGALATTVPTLAGVSVISNYLASAGTATTALFGFITYTTGTVESLPSPEFLITNTNNYQAGVNVSATVGVPTGATGYNLYIGFREGIEWQQNPTIGTPIALGTTTTTYPGLINAIGATRAATNFIGTAANPMLGLANDDFDVRFTAGPIFAANTQPFGADVTGPPMGFAEQYRSKVTALSGGQLIEMSLLQPWTGQLFAGAGLNYNVASGCFVADTSQANKPLTIVDKVQGPINPAYEDVGVNSDTGARVIVSINTTTNVLAF